MNDEAAGTAPESGAPRETLFTTQALESQAQVNALLAEALRAASPNAVYAEPVTKGETTVILAAEISAGIGAGYGIGGGGESGASEGSGGGGGGGGGSFGRPVGYIAIGPNGVRWEPIVDVTKLGIAFFTTIGAMVLGLRAMRRGRN